MNTKETNSPTIRIKTDGSISDPDKLDLTLGQPGAPDRASSGPNGHAVETPLPPGPALAGDDGGPNDRLSSDNLITLKCLISDKINNVNFFQLSNGEIGAYKMGESDPYYKKLIALYNKLPKIISSALVIDLEMMGFEETPKFVTALQLISEQGIWFSHKSVHGQKDLYLCLQERGYYWSKTTKEWLIRHNIDALDGIPKK